MSRPFHSLPAKALLAVVVTALLVTVGLVFGKSRTTPDHHQAPADLLATRLARADTTTLTVRRAAFCDRLPRATVAEALGAPVRSATSWRPGQRVALSPQVTDVGDEYGCSWATGSGATARAWVFSPPITADRAARLVAQRPAGCTPLAGMPTYGAPTSALTCGDSTLLRGLFGDAWLSCELPGHDLDLVGRWCLAVARAAG